MAYQNDVYVVFFMLKHYVIPNIYKEEYYV